MVPIVGIYVIHNTTNDRRYIGSSVDIRRRLLTHFSTLRRGQHENRYLQRAWNKYGEESFIGGVVEECDPTDLLTIEQELVDEHGDYNLNVVVSQPPNRKGQHNTAEHREKCRQANLGKVLGPHSAEWNAKIRASNIGRKRPEGFGARMAQALTGRKATPEHRANIGKALKGRVLSAAHRAKLSAARRRTVAAKAGLS